MYTSTPSLKRKRPAEEDLDSSLLTPMKSTRRKAISSRMGQDPGNTIDPTSDAVPNPTQKARNSRSTKTTTTTTTSSSPAAPERRRRMFRSSPPKSFQPRFKRAITQRMFVVGQTVAGTDQAPELQFDIVGTTGNLYKTIIGKEPACNCPDALKGHQCKHIYYVLAKVLKAPAHLQYQLAFLSSELREIYHNSPLRHVQSKSEEADTDGRRKPVEGDCAICFMEFKPEREEIVWCRAACGNNIHKACFQRWAVSQHAQGVRCVYCRAPWQTQDADGKVDIDLGQLLSQAERGEEGYINVASQMGLSGERDYSTYYHPWVHQRSYYSGQRNDSESYY
ncbi:hypothetical protein P175DRAFT_0536201 [Aspergillus ochraceoroseus IBT 24754]|uniref:Anaphase-promoting complex subunit 11 n=1 Tax=Aspergillus ochraceoroseus IBT 24754 TaxID=1392256 RepID=A0A2T5LM66_9EURO|nr:uncharacterized protein P175DRAFT_0536201 [Aspergillus ochraceoroseus IBT 24754]PTU17378.1 hypothetical protein P175DRAFT_0536201 [Aspergillus ochraceoroseus IBT 24754]